MTRSCTTVGRIQKRIRELLKPALDAAPFWVRGELSSASDRGRGLHCDLIETRDGKVVAKLRCVAWSNELRLIRSRMKEAGLGLDLQDGTEVGFLCKVTYHEQYGLSLQAFDIDPEVSLGAFERRRREILERLQRDGQLERNGALPVPRVALRIGLVGSCETAGYRDFVDTLLRSGFGFHVLAADARVQGEATERTVLRAMDCLGKHDLDLICIVRGGGSRVDLSYLDNEAIARRIAGCAVPVWTGIGHEIDRGVLDDVAGCSFKTPTAVAEALVDRLRREEEWTRICGEQLRQGVERARVHRRRELALHGRRFDVVDGRLGVERERQQTRQKSLHKATTRLLRIRREDLARMQAGMGAAGARVRVEGERLTAQQKSLIKTTGRLLHARTEKRQRLGEGLATRSQYRAEGLRQSLEFMVLGLRRCAVPRRLEQLGQKHQSWHQLLRAADPAVALQRGYAIVYDASGALIGATHGVVAGDRVNITLHDGVLHGEVTSVEHHDAEAAGELGEYLHD